MSTMQIKFQSIQASDINFLQKEDYIYAVDFRATGEELTRNIDAMFKYENNVQWFGGFSSSTAKRHIIINETANIIDDSLYETHVALRDIEQSHVSVFSRLKETPKNIKGLWTAIPHPDADIFASRNNLEINNNYESFLNANDKLAQKKLLGNLTPGWIQFDDIEKLINQASRSKKSYLKKRVGAGGYNVLKLGSANHKNIEKIVHNTKPSEWYIEEEAPGKPYSVQGVLDTNGNATIFGYTKQSIIENTIYIGADILDVSMMSVSLKNHISLAIQSLESILKKYTGFFGIDFMLDGDDIKVLEFNIRLTAASIPALLRNKMGSKTTAIYTEDKKNIDLLPGDIVIAADHMRHESDTLSFGHIKKIAVGYSSFIQLSNTKSLAPKMDDEEISKLKQIITKNVSEVVSLQYHNFWPYGWTATMILAESHCVLSSWHQERNVLVDIFCCKSFDHKKLTDALAEHFIATTSIDELKERYLL